MLYRGIGIGQFISAMRLIAPAGLLQYMLASIKILRKCENGEIWMAA
jgi:hypothetical protein